MYYYMYYIYNCNSLSILTNRILNLAPSARVVFCNLYSAFQIHRPLWGRCTEQPGPSQFTLCFSSCPRPACWYAGLLGLSC